MLYEVITRGAPAIGIAAAYGVVLAGRDVSADDGAGALERIVITSYSIHYTKLYEDRSKMLSLIFAIGPKILDWYRAQSGETFFSNPEKHWSTVV